MHIGGCNICGRAHESGMCIVQDDVSQEVNDMTNPDHQGFHQGGPPGHNLGGNFSQGQGWRSHHGNNFNINQGVSSNRPPNQGPDLYDKTTKLEDTLHQFMYVSLSNHKSIEFAIKNLEVLVGQLAKQLAETSTNSFAANTEKNPKE